ncbi:MAG TPA: SDR family NAD(P)-dependent oxidoreductase, partial [Candidatus Acidoferrum sp.]
MAQRVSIDSSSRQTAQLLGAVALVTGGNRGIGRAIALRLAQLGAAVGICGRNAQALATVEAELKKSGSPIHAQIADVSQSADVTALVDKTQSALGPISILVNNAGIGLFGPAH